MGLEARFFVVVGEFLASLDCAKSEKINLESPNPDRAVGHARVIDEARDVLWNASVDHGRVAGPEKVLPEILVPLFGCCGASDVCDDEGALWCTDLCEYP
jgi:hypothetical protein